MTNDYHDKGCYNRNSTHFYVPRLRHYVRSTWERDIGLMLRFNDINYRYEARSFKVSIHDKERIYTPDFITGNVVIEPHKFIRLGKEKRKYLSFHNQYPEYRFVILSFNDSTEICDKFIQWDNRDKLVQLLLHDNVWKFKNFDTAFR